MAKSKFRIAAGREYDLAELYKLLVREGEFDRPFDLEEGGALPLIRFQGVQDTGIQVYPDGESIVVNLTGGSGDWAEEVAANVPLLEGVCAEIERVVGGGPETDEMPAPPRPEQSEPPPAPPAGAADEKPQMETMLWEVFKASTRLEAYDDRMVTTDKKGRVKTFKYSKIKRLKREKDFLYLTMLNGTEELFSFLNKETTDVWEPFIREKMEE